MKDRTNPLDQVPLLSVERIMEIVKTAYTDGLSGKRGGMPLYEHRVKEALASLSSSGGAEEVERSPERKGPYTVNEKDGMYSIEGPTTWPFTYNFKENADAIRDALNAAFQAGRGEGPQWISVQAYDGLKAHAEAMATADYDPGCDCPKCAAVTAYRKDFPAPQASRSTDTKSHE